MGTADIVTLLLVFGIQRYGNGTSGPERKFISSLAIRIPSTRQHIRLIAGMSWLLAITTRDSGMPKRERRSVGSATSSGWTNRATFSPDGKYVLTSASSTDGKARRWETSTSQLLREYQSAPMMISKPLFWQSWKLPKESKCSLHFSFMRIADKWYSIYFVYRVEVMCRKSTILARLCHCRGSQYS